jgi:hypothetical protein
MKVILLLLIVCLIEAGTTEKIKVKCAIEDDEKWGQSCFLIHLLIKEDTELEIENSDKTQDVKTIIYSESTLELIPAIDPKVFPKFETLEISNSTITKFDKKFFKNAVEAKSLLLDGLKLLRIQADFFENLHKVENISITDCELQNLTEPIFDSLKDHLKSLTLTTNEIDIVNPIALNNLNLQAGEFHDKCAGHVKFPDANLAEKLKTCYQNFETFTSKQVDKLSIKLFDTMDKLSAMEKAMTKKIAELERKLREETENKTEVPTYNDEKIRVSIQDQQITIFCLILLSLIGIFLFIAMFCITKKSLVENKKK